jgi:two-component system, sensor histidine kinase PdtaS
MPTLGDLLREHGRLTPAEEDWLHLLVGDWQLLSDLSFADLVLWVPAAGREGYVAVAHCRPSTGATVHHEDLVGTWLPRGHRPQLDAALDRARISRAREPDWRDDVPVREESIPVVREGRVLAVLARHTNLSQSRAPSRLEIAYLQCADALVRMIAEGTFPSAAAPTGARRGAPRVGDGMIRLDAEGTVLFASPNARAAFHRVGVLEDIHGASLVEVASAVVESPGQVDETLPLVLTGRAPWRAELEVRRSALSLRAVPLLAGGVRTGALLLCRDVSELRRREQELLTKDATIREIHHRVKNNLQTVAALLRLQARRIDSPEGRVALSEAMRRVSTIALVHETLAQRFEQRLDFDPVADRCLALAVDVAVPGASERRPVQARREGSIGPVKAEDATALALVVTELVTNAVEHGLPDGGSVLLRAERCDPRRLVIDVEDDGVGVTAGKDPLRSPGLGLQIVRGLVTGELNGTIGWEAGAGGRGTRWRIEVALRDGAVVP